LGVFGDGATSVWQNYSGGSLCRLKRRPFGMIPALSMTGLRAACQTVLVFQNRGRILDFVIRSFQKIQRAAKLRSPLDLKKAED
jgi:hypothetical protein